MKRKLKNFSPHLGVPVDINYFRLQAYIRSITGATQNVPKLIRKRQHANYQQLKRGMTCS